MALLPPCLRPAVARRALPAVHSACGGTWLPGPSFLFLVVDNPDPVLPLPDAPCPGHVNFSDELCASLRLSDGVLLVVDAVGGVMVGTERAIKAAAAEGLPICLLISKVDRQGRGQG